MYLTITLPPPQKKERERSLKQCSSLGVRAHYPSCLSWLCGSDKFCARVGLGGGDWGYTMVLLGWANGTERQESNSVPRYEACAGLSSSAFSLHSTGLVKFWYFHCWRFFFGGGHVQLCSELFLALCSGVTPGSAYETICILGL